MSDEAEERDASETGTPSGAARRPSAWMILAVVAAALLVCCCSAAVGLLISWAAGLFHAPT
ncbi:MULTISPECIES: hypothetical protein [unclassified Micromonospora]|uniref:hypothetical protein n=1 Tax=unclassified Micromonospora TaxID=2617518 RepID=UPI000EF44A34|nr:MULTISPECIES: hypothetical protein [unclassified Micromonospora]RLP91468.1 hypothetical protein EAD89_11495 [Micromonospora sp. BL4]RLP95624.1 hypothetical protein EAD98_13000 [Micromonospora sp. CV4]